MKAPHPDSTPFARSQELRKRAHAVIPAGAHTYSKGDDQFPEIGPGFISRGAGCRVEDVDGNSFIDWGMGLRAVVLGHAFAEVNDAAIAQIRRGTNFTRPAPIEVELAELLVDLIPSAEMVKFAKNGSDATTAAIRLSRAATGRDRVAFPHEQPFFSVDDWFIGATTVDAGIPESIKRLSARFNYGDLTSLEQLLDAHPGEFAAVILECATSEPPPEGFLQGVRELTRKHGTVLIFDEMITGFRWHLGGAQSFYGVTPDLSTFGKAIGNGFSVAVLAGKREIMELGGLHHELPRVFLLSTTHGGETHSLAAAKATIEVMQEQGVIEHIWRIGKLLQDQINAAAVDAGVESVASIGGYPCSPLLTFEDGGDASAAQLRTLFMQELIQRGVLMPYVAPSFSHDDADVDETVTAAQAAFAELRRVLDGEPVAELLVGEAARPVFRKFNRDI